MENYVNEFTSWVREGIAEASGGALSSDSVFSERSSTFADDLRKALAGATGLACGISRPTLRRVQGEGADDTLLRLSLNVGVLRSKLSKVDSDALAERLFAAFSAACWRTVPGNGAPDVWADDYSSQESSKGIAHTFTISTQFLLKTD